MATIADIRRGDKFTHSGRTYIAADDARPSGVTGYYDVTTLPGTAKADDGVIRQGALFGRDITVRPDFAVDIITRGLTVEMLWETTHNQRPEATTASEDAVRFWLGHITRQREAAQRQSADLDLTRDKWIRAALALSVPVTEIAHLAGLSRERIYQIRDGRR
ncbi:hypothetical protein [Streptomyces sp. t39]|uniref:hypothetical protein n=1 Tax=Streptomyces sp. t39 TaxID=1828156 RepID=UPI0011CDCB95|nr:hypothetical protein [Streptomyces sp. t39]TXS35134.1 hypothetical protein EAO77_37730 [Streptomyces sp. t39]